MPDQLPTPDVRIAGFVGGGIDVPDMIAERLRAKGLSCETRDFGSVPISGLSLSGYREVAGYLRQNPGGPFTIFFSGAAEYFVPADLGLHFSAYRSWFDETRLRVLPYAWSNAAPRSDQQVRWTEKPPFRIGFMGALYANSRIAGIVGRQSPAIRQWILEGRQLRLAPWLYAAGLPLRNLQTFVRSETVATLTQAAPEIGAELTVVDTTGISNNGAQVTPYADHMAAMTYVLCPRGVENYSFRLFEALKFGRVPVIIDTDMVLLDRVDWKAVAVRVDYRDLPRIGEILAEDYRTRTAADFISRQEQAFALIEELQGCEWLDRLADEIVEAVASRRRSRENA